MSKVRLFLKIAYGCACSMLMSGIWPQHEKLEENMRKKKNWRMHSKITINILEKIGRCHFFIFHVIPVQLSFISIAKSIIQIINIIIIYTVFCMKNLSMVCKGGQSPIISIFRPVNRLLLATQSHNKLGGKSKLNMSFPASLICVLVIQKS